MNNSPLIEPVWSDTDPVASWRLAEGAYAYVWDNRLYVMHPEHPDAIVIVNLDAIAPAMLGHLFPILSRASYVDGQDG